MEVEMAEESIDEGCSGNVYPTPQGATDGRHNDSRPPRRPFNRSSEESRTTING